MSTQDKETAVRDLIYSTSSRVIQGVRYLPIIWYHEQDNLQPDEIIDEHNRNVDRDGLPIVETDEELVVVQQGKGNDRRSSKDIAMPSSTAVLSDASTDSDRALPIHKKAKRQAPPVWPSQKVRFYCCVRVHLSIDHFQCFQGSTSGDSKDEPSKKKPKTDSEDVETATSDQEKGPTSDAFAPDNTDMFDMPTQQAQQSQSREQSQPDTMSRDVSLFNIRKVTFRLTSFFPTGNSTRDGQAYAGLWRTERHGSNTR